MKKMITFEEEYNLYVQGGFTKLETMLDLSRGNISGDDTIKATELGFAGDAAFLKKIRQGKEFWMTPTLVEELQHYADAGFRADKQTVLELHQDRYDNTPRTPRVASEYAKFLAEHGLYGDKEAMIKVAEQVNYDTVHNLALRIAYGLTGKSFWRISGNLQYGEADTQRREMADQIPAGALVLLETYDWGQNKLWRKTELSAAWVNGTDNSVSEKITDFEDELLMKTFRELQEQGEEVFRTKYLSCEEQLSGYNVLSEAFPESKDQQQTSKRFDILNEYSSSTGRFEAEEILRRYGLTLG